MIYDSLICVKEIESRENKVSRFCLGVQLFTELFELLQKAIYEFSACVQHLLYV